jgi:hypothetical protein
LPSIIQGFFEARNTTAPREENAYSQNIHHLKSRLKTRAALLPPKANEVETAW